NEPEARFWRQGQLSRYQCLYPLGGQRDREVRNDVCAGSAVFEPHSEYHQNGFMVRRRLEEALYGFRTPEESGEDPTHPSRGGNRNAVQRLFLKQILDHYDQYVSRDPVTGQEDPRGVYMGPQAQRQEVPVAAPSPPGPPPTPCPPEAAPRESCGQIRQ